MGGFRESAAVFDDEGLGAARQVLSHFQEIYSDRGVFLVGRATFIVHDESGESIEIFVEFEPDRGDGEYVMVVPHP